MNKYLWPENEGISRFLLQYEEHISGMMREARMLILKNLPAITEQTDLPARMIAYCYGQKYTDMICMLIPSKKGIKISFFNGISLADPDHLLEGKAKTTRYLNIKTGAELHRDGVRKLIKNALDAYKERSRFIK